MKQYAVVAYDYTDDEALDRRLANRNAHLEGVRELARQGKFLSGGAILNDEGKMIGSNAHFRFADRQALDAWLETEPYMTGRVWEHVEIREVKLFDPNA
ncbi:YciI family protein [Halomonas sp. McH1-25]|uniref:YciI family protein n=1 Tax=unclassified Halomonas TaxID=2609666 RepID=UPI001EF75158|nr:MULTISPECIES: YciI family protein [unclassified Halomonas]MCG7599332.1 YciI family protein [Halomonas sp. McH1-25]MCP1343842.1 YciI family protein [Halomonas sp. FL8]MCP1361113.1 YciI family protein [Halomonas sp. BBD45]MCP1364849.1 YciI family protein [Halomonas sp. BBD48]